MAKHKKVNRNPADEKRRDMRRVRSDLGPAGTVETTANGIPIVGRRPGRRPLKKGGETVDAGMTPLVSGWGRPRFLKNLRARNGSQEFLGNDGDAWNGPDVNRKSGRAYQREMAAAWDEAGCKGDVYGDEDEG